MIYLVVEKFYDSENSYAKIIFSSEDEKTAETVKANNENKHHKEIEDAKIVLSELNNVNYDEMSQLQKIKYNSAEQILYFMEWYKTEIRALELNKDINIYI